MSSLLLIHFIFTLFSTRLSLIKLISYSPLSIYSRLIITSISLFSGLYSRVILSTNLLVTSLHIWSINCFYSQYLNSCCKITHFTNQCWDYIHPSSNRLCTSLLVANLHPWWLPASNTKAMFLLINFMIESSYYSVEIVVNKLSVCIHANDIYRLRSLFNKVNKNQVLLLYKHIIDTHIPISLSYNYSYGSLLFIIISIQLLTGIVLSFHYCRSDSVYGVILFIINRVYNGSLLRIIHVSMATFLFLVVYLHIIRGLWLSSYRNVRVFILGIVLLLVLIATAFTGYVLPWGQISLWGATVITNIFSVIPIIGYGVCSFIWGEYFVDHATLTTFFRLHVLLPMLMLVLSFIHVLLLHSGGSSRPLRMYSDLLRIKLDSSYLLKDSINWLVLHIAVIIILWSPLLFTDPDNSIIANHISSPVHIVPEWYFLWLYALLRRVPSKLGGVLIILTSIAMFVSLSVFSIITYRLDDNYVRTLVAMVTRSVLILGILGCSIISYPYIVLSVITMLLFFISITILLFHHRFMLLVCR